MVDATISRPGCAVWRVWAAQVPAGTPLTRRAPRARALHAVSRSPVQTGIGKRLPARPRRPAHAPSVRSHGINHLAAACGNPSRGSSCFDLSDESPVVRASDAEREQTAELLRRHMVNGRLTLEEFVQRVDAVYGSRSRAELDALTRDLPADSLAPGRRSKLRPKRFTGVAFGRVERKGRWRVPRVATLAVVFGDADLDLRTAEIEDKAVTLTAFVLFGNADFYVPV